SLNEFGLVLGLVFVSPGQLIAAQMVGGFAALVLHRRQRPVKAAFNLAQFALTSCLALIVFGALSHQNPGGLEPRDWVAASVAAVAACLAGVLLVAAAISIAESRIKGRTLLSVAAVSLTGTVANASLALAAAKLI